MTKRYLILIVGLVAAAALYWGMQNQPAPAPSETPAPAPVADLEPIIPVPEDANLSGESAPLAKSAKKQSSEIAPEITPADTGVPWSVLEAMKVCLGIPLQSEDKSLDFEATKQGTKKQKPKPEGSGLLSIEEFLAETEKALGPPLMQGDLWTDWVLRMPEGLDRKVHLENVDDGEGRIHQNLTIFEIDQSGKSNRIHATNVEERNPSMSSVFALLNSGEVQRKEAARYFLFAGGERVELIELNSTPTELEVVRSETFFRCDEMKVSESCHCIR